MCVYVCLFKVYMWGVCVDEVQVDVCEGGVHV